VANAPTRPPGRPRSERRPPRGPRVTHPLRHGLELVRKHLKQEKQHELQAYVDTVLAPRGWMGLRDSETSGPTVPLSLTITKGLKDQLKSAEAEFGLPLASLAEDGFRAVLESDWLPSRTVEKRSLRSYQDDPANARAVLQLQVDTDLRDRVREALDQIIERAGYKVTLSSVALSWMADELGVKRPGENTQPLLLQHLPHAWCEHWEAVAAERGVTVQSVMDDGIRALRDGAWQMPKPVRPAKGSGFRTQGVHETRAFSVRVDAELLEYLEEQSPVLAKEFGRKVFPGVIGLAILKDRLGLPAAE